MASVSGISVPARPRRARPVNITPPPAPNRRRRLLAVGLPRYSPNRGPSCPRRPDCASRTGRDRPLAPASYGPGRPAADGRRCRRRLARRARQVRLDGGRGARARRRRSATRLRRACRHTPSRRRRRSAPTRVRACPPGPTWDERARCSARRRRSCRRIPTSTRSRSTTPRAGPSPGPGGRRTFRTNASPAPRRSSSHPAPPACASCTSGPSRRSDRRAGDSAAWPPSTCSRATARSAAAINRRSPFETAQVPVSLRPRYEGAGESVPPYGFLLGAPGEPPLLEAVVGAGVACRAPAVLERRRARHRPRAPGADAGHRRRHPA